MEIIGKIKAKKIARRLGSLREADLMSATDIDDLLREVCSIVGPEFRAEVNKAANELGFLGLEEI